MWEPLNRRGFGTWLSNLSLSIRLLWMGLGYGFCSLQALFHSPANGTSLGVRLVNIPIQGQKLCKKCMSISILSHYTQYQLHTIKYKYHIYHHIMSLLHLHISGSCVVYTS